MEITFSKTRLLQITALLLIAAAAFFAARILLADNAPATPYPDEPAMQALNVIYNPAGEQAAWEQSACANMSAKGCEIFKAHYAAPIWGAGLQATRVTFVSVRDILQDGTQVWQTEASTATGSAQPIFIHVEQREDGGWALARILFEEEARVYAK